MINEISKEYNINRMNHRATLPKEKITQETIGEGDAKMENGEKKQKDAKWIDDARSLQKWGNLNKMTIQGGIKQDLSDLDVDSRFLNRASICCFDVKQLL